jgi:hypothetical protein
LLYLYQWTYLPHDVAEQNLTENIFLVVAVNVGILLLILPWIRFFEVPEDIYNEQAMRLDAFWPDQLKLILWGDTLDIRMDEQGQIVEGLVLNVRSNQQTEKIVELDARLITLTFTRVDEDTGEARSLPFIPDLRLTWENGDVEISLRPGEERFLYLGRLSEEEPRRLVLGAEGFVNWLFEKEAVYQLSLRLQGKIEGETDFRQMHHGRTVIYANPTENRLSIGEQVLDHDHIDVPKQLVPVFEAAEKGYAFFKNA